MKLCPSPLRAKLLTAASFTIFLREQCFLWSKKQMPADFPTPSFSSGQNKPLSQRVELCGIHSFLACYEVIRDKEENTKTETRKLALQSYFSGLWVKKDGLPLAKGN